VDSDRSACCTPWAPCPLARGLLDLAAVDGDEGELGGDEDATRDDQQESGGQQDPGGQR
jgi:hypothetical protein